MSGTITYIAPDTGTERINTVAASGTAVTIPDPGKAKINRIKLTGNVTITMPAASAGKVVYILFEQDATGNRTVSWPSGTLFAGGTNYVATVTAGAMDLVAVYCVDEDVWLVVTVAAALAT